MPDPKPSRFADIDAELSRPLIRCKLCRVIAELDDEDAAYIRGMLNQPVAVKGHKHIATVLERGGIPLSESTVGSCRAGRHQAPA